MTRRRPPLSRAAALAAVGPGWRPALTELLDELDRLGVVVWRVSAGPQLDVRWVAAPAVRAAAERRLALARSATRDTCERCGAPGRPRALVESATVLCDDCPA